MLLCFSLDILLPNPLGEMLLYFFCLPARVYLLTGLPTAFSQTRPNPHPIFPPLSSHQPWELENHWIGSVSRTKSLEGFSSVRLDQPAHPREQPSRCESVTLGHPSSPCLACIGISPSVEGFLLPISSLLVPK